MLETSSQYVAPTVLELTRPGWSRTHRDLPASASWVLELNDYTSTVDLRHHFFFLNPWASASNVSHTVVLRPLKAGYFNFTSATITYLAQEDGPVVIGSTSAPGQGGILAQREFDRRFSPHFLDWAAFGVMTLPSIGIPLLLWYSSKRKYDTPKPKKN